MNAAAWLVVLQLAGPPAGSHDRAGAGAGHDTAAAAAGPTVSRTAQFLAGGAAGLAIHEAGHVATAIAFDARPSVGAIRFGPIPFFAVRHAPVTRRREFVISSAGFWMQHASSEWLLTRRPRLRGERAPVAKGILAFNLGASAVYSVAAFGSFGPGERDTLGMARSLGRDGVSEAWVGALILAPAVLDGYRYLHPEARWAAWVSRGVKVAAVALTAAAGRSP
jgi:hypothetical protein